MKLTELQQLKLINIPIGIIETGKTRNNDMNSKAFLVPFKQRPELVMIDCREWIVSGDASILPGWGG